MKSKFFWGIFLLLASAYLIISGLGIIPAVGVVRAVGTVICIGIMVSSIYNVSFGGILFPLAFIGILYDEALHIEAITPWPLLIAALLGTIGLNLLFGGMRIKIKYKSEKKKYEHETEQWENASVENMNGEEIKIVSRFGSVIRYITSENFKSADVTVRFGAAKIYLDNAMVPAGNATLNLDVSFGGVEIYVPKNWQVINHLDASFGGVDEKGKQSTDVVSTLTLQGSANFSGVEIRYI